MIGVSKSVHHVGTVVIFLRLSKYNLIHVIKRTFHNEPELQIHTILLSKIRLCALLSSQSYIIQIKVTMHTGCYLQMSHIAFSMSGQLGTLGGRVFNSCPKSCGCEPSWIKICLDHIQFSITEINFLVDNKC